MCMARYVPVRVFFGSQSGNGFVSSKQHYHYPGATISLQASEFKVETELGDSV